MRHTIFEWPLNDKMSEIWDFENNMTAWTLKPWPFFRFIIEFNWLKSLFSNHFRAFAKNSVRASLIIAFNEWILLRILLLIAWEERNGFQLYKPKRFYINFCVLTPLERCVSYSHAFFKGSCVNYDLPTASQTFPHQINASSTAPQAKRTRKSAKIVFRSFLR